MKDYNKIALRRCEDIGVYEYAVKGNEIHYYSYFGSEGLYKIVHNLDTHKETRTHLKYKKIPKHLIGRYNYFTG